MKRREEVEVGFGWGQAWRKRSGWSERGESIGGGGSMRERERERGGGLSELNCTVLREWESWPLGGGKCNIQRSAQMQFDRKDEDASRFVLLSGHKIARLKKLG